jgi:uncharacterized protein YpmB
MTKKEIIEQLKANGIDANAKLTKKELELLLDNAQAVTTAPEAAAPILSVYYTSKQREYFLGDFPDMLEANRAARVRGVKHLIIRDKKV